MEKRDKMEALIAKLGSGGKPSASQCSMAAPSCGSCHTTLINVYGLCSECSSTCLYATSCARGKQEWQGVTKHYALGRGLVPAAEP